MPSKSRTTPSPRTPSEPKLQRNITGIYLGFPFDQLLSKSCPYLVTQREQGENFENKQGILLPRDDDPGSGNIIISGPPGSGKSTLALQFAVACAKRPENRAVSAYVALENSPAEIHAKARLFEWDKFVRDLKHPPCLSSPTTSRDLSDALLSVLTQPKSCPMESRISSGGGAAARCQDHIKLRNNIRKNQLLEGIVPKVLIATLSPRPVSLTAESDFFWRRYRQLEQLLSAANQLRLDLRRGNLGPSEHAIFPVMVIDSLNMFAARPLKREETLQLFNLFKRYKTVGIFVVESTQDTPFDSTIADIVIKLSMEQDNGYFVRYIEVEKSRYRDKIDGRHPVKTHPLSDTPLPDNVNRDELCTPPIPGKHPGGVGDLRRHGMVVFPSLHYVVLRAASSEDEKTLYSSSEDESRWQEPGATWGIGAFDQLLPKSLQQGSVIAVEGPRGTFKTNLAMTFLAKGLLDGEAGLLVRLHDESLLRQFVSRNEGPALSKEICDKDFKWSNLRSLDQAKTKLWQNLAKRQKATINVYRYRSSQPKQPYLYEVNFKSGALLPEEFMEIVWDIIIRQPDKDEGRIRRIVLDDVSEIGAAYPFLRKSLSSGDILLPAFAHVMRSYKIDLVVTGTTGQFQAADDAVGKICAVADTVLSCRFCDVFGKRCVTVHGEGLIEEQQQEQDLSHAKATPVIQNSSQTTGARAFYVDPHYLEGLVGFDTGNVHRPGLALYVFDGDGDIHRQYNTDLDFTLRAALDRGAVSITGASSGAASITDALGRLDPPPKDLADVPAGLTIVRPFGSRYSETIHDSLRVFTRQEPIEKTVLYTVDEFWYAQDPHDSNPAERFIPFRIRDILENKEDIRKNPPMVRNVQRFMGEYAYVWPYYLNVLVLAYRKDIVQKNRKWTSWGDVLQAAREVSISPSLGESSANRETPEIGRAFWSDRTAPETLSCALLDALRSVLAAQGITVPNGPKTEEDILTVFYKWNSARSRRGKSLLRSVALDELMNLHNLFALAKIERPFDPRPSGEMILAPDSAIYLCWYSQLRSLIKSCPALADKLGVCSLPGGGYTGDWFIGIVQGSVSPALGTKVIKNLCNMSEEFKRFSQGVGLPVRQKFKGRDFLAWDRAEGVSLDDILAIHRKAHSRAAIHGYGKIRSRLALTGLQITYPAEGAARAKVDGIVGRLYPQVEMLRESVNEQ